MNLMYTSQSQTVWLMGVHVCLCMCLCLFVCVCVCVCVCLPGACDIVCSSPSVSPMSR